jgi:hypothetical protein
VSRRAEASGWANSGVMVISKAKARADTIPSPCLCSAHINRDIRAPSGFLNEVV